MEREQAAQAITEIQELISERQVRNFVAQAHSRAVLQRLGADPTQWPRYSPVLDENLLYTAHLLFWQGLQLKTQPDFQAQGDDLLKQGAEILEFLYSEAEPASSETVEQLFSAALGYYIAGHYARAYVLMKDLGGGDALPQELELLRLLFLKNLTGLRDMVLQVLENERHSDAMIAAAIRAGDITEDEALDHVLRASMNRAFSYFTEFPKSGRRSHIEQARELLTQGMELAEKARFVHWWWLFYCARYLFDEFDANSLWTQLGPLLNDDEGGRLVEPYIRTNYRRDTPVLELWRSQTAALPHINEVERCGYCLKMPTSAGKTRVAELAILRFLLDYLDDPESKCIYVAPFRSLAVELESSLRQSFHPLGVRVSELYGGFDLSPVERLLMEQARIVVATPEKMDALLRYNSEFADQVRLVVVDEGHIINPTERGVRFEFFLHRLITRFANRDVRFLFLSAVLPNVDEFAAWITGSPNNVIRSDWRPSRLILGELRWGGRITSIHYTHSGHNPLEHQCYVPSFIEPLEGEQLRGTGRRNPFPNDMQEAIADAALRFAKQDMTLVFIAQRRSVEPFGRQLLRAVRIKDTVARRDEGEFHLPISEEGGELLEECIALAEELMGADAEVIEFLRAGFVVHHSGLPQKLRLKIEQLVRRQVLRLVVATTTLAQGVNFPIRTVIVHSLRHGYRQPLSPLDFWNICGRAGRGMKENEGQVLFAVDLTWDRRRRLKERQLRQGMIEGHRTYRVLSALRQVLHYIVQQWQSVHPGVDVAELCQSLAENSLDWASPAEREEMAAWLDFLDAQLIALTEELDTEEITPDDFQTLLQRSLLILQLESGPEGVLTAKLANNLLYARLQSIRGRFPVRSQRQRFYQLGFPLTDCGRIDENRDHLIERFMTTQDYYQWSPETRCDFLASLLEFLFSLRELKPDGSSLPRRVIEEWQQLAERQQLGDWRQLENWRQLWVTVLNLWLRGCTPGEIAEDASVAEITSSPATVSLLVDDLFGYRAPWGLNALSVYLQEVGAEADKEMPSVTSYFSALLKYGVHSPAASSLLAFGLESRKLALKLAEQCPNEAMESYQLLLWFTSLTQRELASFGLAQDEITATIEAQQRARRITQMAPRQRLSWAISITVPDQALAKLQEGDSLVLQTRLDIGGRAFALYTLWGDSLGNFEAPDEIPTAWTSPDRIEVVVTEIRRRDEVASLGLRIAEV